MRKLLFNTFFIALFITAAIAALVFVAPYNPVDLEQAQRIAQWKSEYEKLAYSFALVKLYEGSIIPDKKEGEHISRDDIYKRFQPYFNLETIHPSQYLKYSYRKMNGTKLKAENQFRFDEFVKTKSGVLISVKRNLSLYKDESEPDFYMFIDINGLDKPNKIGRDIFFINIYKYHITPLGAGKSNSKVKMSCSPIGNGLFCSESYLIGGRMQ